MRDNQNQNHLQLFPSVNQRGLYSLTQRVAKRPVVNRGFLLSLSNRGPCLAGDRG